MSYPLKELSQLLAKESVMSGIVLEVNNASVKVATSQGAAMTRTLDTLKIGDRVLVKNGMATRAPIASTTIPV